MTISDVLLIVFSTAAISGLYLLGRYAKKAQQQDAIEKHEKK